MRIGIFADDHGNLPALQAVLADGRAQGITQWVCLGDVAYKGPYPAECIETIRAIPGVVQIVGNTDQWLFQGFPPGFTQPPERMQQLQTIRKWTLTRLDAALLAHLQQLPLSSTLALDGQEVLCVHAAPGDTGAWLPPSLSEQELTPLVTGHSAGIVAYGHVHNGYIRRVGGRTVVNPGSVGNPTDGDNRASYAVLRAAAGVTTYELRRVPYPLAETVAAAKEAGMPYMEQYAAALQAGTVF
jgi:putative phosphoesterase